jgi:hypothetical protein
VLLSSTSKMGRSGELSDFEREIVIGLLTNRDHREFKKVVRQTHQTSIETITREFRSATICPARTMTVRRELRAMGFHG